MKEKYGLMVLGGIAASSFLCNYYRITHAVHGDICFILSPEEDSE